MSVPSVSINPEELVLWSDEAIVSSSEIGLVIDFAQTNKDGAEVVKRIGMSHHQARILAESIQEGIGKA